MIKTSVLIVGAGPAGLAAAILLKRYGIDFIIIDKKSHVSHYPKARDVNMRSMELLRQWGLEPHLRNKELPIDYHIFQWASDVNQHLVQTIYSKKTQNESSPTSYCLVFQNHVEHIMINFLTNNNGVKILFNNEAIELLEESSRVITTIKDKLVHREFKISSQFVLAADGFESKIRHLSRINMHGEPDMGQFNTIFFKANLEHFFQDKKFCSLYITNKNKLANLLIAINGIDEWMIWIKNINQRSLSHKNCQDLIKDFLACNAHDNIDINIIETQHWTMKCLIADRFSTQRVFLLGDSAHCLPPTGSIGLNLALQDAHNLCWKIKYVLHHHAPLSLLNSYHDERKYVAQIYIEWGNARRKQVNEVLSKIQSISDIEEVKHLIYQLGQSFLHDDLDLNYIYQSNAVQSTNDATAKILIGKRAPHFWLNDKKTYSTLDLYDSKFVVISSNPSVKNILQQLDFSFKKYFKLYDKTHNQMWQHHFGNLNNKMIIVRPDGYIAFIENCNENMTITKLKKIFQQLHIIDR